MTPQLPEDRSSIYVPKSQSAVPIRPGPHLFVDDYLIESCQGIPRTVCQPKRDASIPNPVVTGPEDQCFQPFFKVVRDPETKRFRIWYGARRADKSISRSHLAHMESGDGVRWIRPHQVLATPDPIQFGSDVIDEGPGHPDPSKRYKYGYYFGGGLRIAYSPDGLDWTPLAPHVVIHHSHDVNNISWDPLRQCYSAIVSTNLQRENWTRPRRLTMQSFSHDLVNWTEPWYAVTPDDSIDDGETQFYAMSGFLVRGSLRLGMVKVLRDDLKADEPPKVLPEAYGLGYTTLAWTRDGRSWTRDREVFFDRNPEPGTWDRAHTWIDEQVIVGDEVYLYYCGYKQGHKVNRFEERQIGLVKIPLDRYVARQTQDDSVGRLVTVPLQVDGSPGRLVVNAEAASGRLRVQVRDAATDEVVPGLSFDDCQAISDDGLRVPVRWGTGDGLGAVAGRMVRLEFELTSAKLFAFDFESPNGYCLRPAAVL